MASQVQECPHLIIIHCVPSVCQVERWNWDAVPWGIESGGRDRLDSRQLFHCVLSAVVGKIGWYGNIFEGHVKPGLWGLGEVVWKSNSEAET